MFLEDIGSGETMETLKRMQRFNYDELKQMARSLVQFCMPGIICFFCICIFLLLSLMLIEQHSISQAILKERTIDSYKTAAE